MLASCLNQELVKRQQELEKLQTLDQKIGVELKSLSEKMATMQTEMVTYANIDQLKVSNDRITELLQHKKIAYQRRCESARQQVNIMAAKCVSRSLLLSQPRACGHGIVLCPLPRVVCVPGTRS